MNEHKRMVAKRGRERRVYERIGAMKAEHWTMVRVLGIAPYTIDKVEGTYLVEFSRTGRSLPLNQWHEVPVVAFDLRHPDGKSVRYPTLREARHAGAMAAAERRKGVTA
jgi:hypothetical protein